VKEAAYPSVQTRSSGTDTLSEARYLASFREEAISTAPPRQPNNMWQKIFLRLFI